MNRKVGREFQCSVIETVFVTAVVVYEYEPVVHEFMRAARMPRKMRMKQRNAQREMPARERGYTKRI